MPSAESLGYNIQSGNCSDLSPLKMTAPKSHMLFWEYFVYSRMHKIGKSVKFSVYVSKGITKFCVYVGKFDIRIGFCNFMRGLSM